MKTNLLQEIEDRLKTDPVEKIAVSVDSVDPSDQSPYLNYARILQDFLNLLLDGDHKKMYHDLPSALSWAIHDLKACHENYVYMSDRHISYGQGDESINSEEGQKRLWDEHRIVYPKNGVFAFQIIKRVSVYKDLQCANPLIQLYSEDDESLFPAGDKNRPVTFDTRWLDNLSDLIQETRSKLKVIEAEGGDVKYE